MGKSTIRLSSAEIGGLWSSYQQNSMSVCLLKYLLHHLKDDEIKPILDKALHIAQLRLRVIKGIFHEENIPIPVGFTDDDINLSAPPLFYDPFALSFVYSMSRMEMINYSFITANVARSDVMEFFTNYLKDSIDLYQESTNLMLDKGVYDRPPMVPYPRDKDFIEKKSYIAGLFGEKRPLNTIELAELFFNIERNYFAVLLCTGLLQVVEDKTIKNFIQDGKEICEKQIKVFNGLLLKENLLGTVPVSMEVTDSQTSPFSNKLIMTLFHSLNAVDITLIAHALSVSMRVDLAMHYNKFIEEILLYAGKGFNIMVEHSWLEQPPQVFNRNIPS